MQPTVYKILKKLRCVQNLSYFYFAKQNNYNTKQLQKKIINKHKHCFKHKKIPYFKYHLEILLQNTKYDI